MVVLTFCAKGLGLYSIGNGTPSCLCIDDLSGQINVFGRDYKLVTFWKNLVYICIWQYIEFLKFFMYLKIRRLFFLQKIERSSIPDFLFHLASMAEANWWLSNLDCMWALQVALIPLLFVSLPTLSPNKRGHLSSGSLHIFLIAKKCISIPISVSKVGKWKIDQEDRALQAKWERQYFLSYTSKLHSFTMPDFELDIWVCSSSCQSHHHGLMDS